MPIDTRPISELLKNAPLSDLKTICSAITPFIKGGEPPQILTLDNKILIDILKKYGLVDGDSPSNFKCHPDLGEVKLYNANPAIAGGEYVAYIDPTPMMQKSDEESKKLTGSTGNSSPFDTITSNALFKNLLENSQSWDEKIKKSWEERKLLIRLVRTPDGELSVQYWEKDDEETKRQQKRALEQAEKNNQKVWVTDQYKIISEPTTELPFNTSVIANTISSGYGGANLIGTQDTNLTTSPLGNASANFEATRKMTDNYVMANKQNKPPLYNLYGILSITKRTINFLGNFDYKNFTNGVHGTWGGMLHTAKDWTTTLGALYNYGGGLYLTVNGLYDYSTGNPDGVNDIELGGKMIVSEAAVSPLVQRISENIAKSLIEPSPTGRTAFTQQEFKIIQETKPSLLTDVKKNPKTGQPYPIVNAKTAAQIEKQLIDQKVGPTIGKISVGIYGGYSTIKYGPYIFGLHEKVLTAEEELARRNTAMNSVGPNGKPTDQIGIAIQSNNQLIVDSNVIEVINPNTGQIERVTLPGSICYPPVDVYPTDSDSLETNIQNQLQQQENLLPANIYPLLPSKEDLTFPQKLSKSLVDASKAIGIFEAHLPENQLIREAIETITKLLGEATDKVSKLNVLRNFLRGTKFAKFLRILNHPVVTAALTAWDLMPLSNEELYEEYTRRKSELDDKCTRGLLTKEECKKLREELESDWEEAQRIRGMSFSDILSPEQDPYLNSDTELALEVETAKNDYYQYSQILANLDSLGEQIESGTSPVPEVDISSINQDISFVVNTDNPKPSWASPIANLNTPWYTPGCFPEYILIKVKNGFKKISELNVGDSVISFNEFGNFEDDEVSETFIHERKDIWRYYFENGKFIDITKEHPVLVDINKFEEIGKLNINDSVIDEDGNYLKIERIEFLFTDTVYNIEVSKNHTYIADGIRVHNKLGRQLDRGLINQNARAILLFAEDSERRERDYFDWIDENFPGVLQDGWPVETDYPPVTGTPTEQVPSSGEEPTPYEGVPGGTEPSTQSDSPIASGDIPRNVPKEILFNLPEEENGCFPHYSLVSTPRGNIQIDSLNVGDEVYVYDINGNKSVSFIDKVFIHKTTKNGYKVFSYFTSNGEQLNATSNHSVLSKIEDILRFERLDRLKTGSVLIKDNFVESEIIDVLKSTSEQVYHIVPNHGRIISVDGFLVDTMALVYE